MPFGIKPFGDGSGRTYDFDKVYRVIMQRAIRQAGMQPIRADEGIGSKIIHTEMFKDLRDQPVVLADLSLNNPNVFYELGIRHVMSSAGTVLMCQEGTSLPFDVRLSRCIFYQYDGQSLDWEEAEKIVEQLQIALQQARQGEPDSPIHALLERVTRDEASSEQNILLKYPSNKDGNLDSFQKIVSIYWHKNGYDFDELLAQYRSTTFGVRALGFLCLSEENFSKKSSRVARSLYELEQYDLANKLYEKLYTNQQCDYFDLLTYASSYSEIYTDLNGVNQALQIIDASKESIRAQFSIGDITNIVVPHNDERNLLRARAEYYIALASMLKWKSKLTGDMKDLEEALYCGKISIEFMSEARLKNAFEKPGHIARTSLYLALMLRQRDNNINRMDQEGYLEKTLQVQPMPGDSLADLSYLNWYQAIALADLGNGDLARRKAISAYAEDSRLMKDQSALLNDEDLILEIGKWQYTNLRRFLESYSNFLRNPSLIGSIAQVLQVEHK